MDSELRLAEWMAADRRVSSAPADRISLLDALAEAVHEELRRRVGRPFELDELVDAYEAGTDWGVELLTQRAPHAPWAWDPRLAVDAGFARYARHASDVGGGRRLRGERDRD